MIRGAIEHRDSCGNHGVIRDGGVQWMTAGRGIVHSGEVDEGAGHVAGVGCVVTA